LGSFLDAKFVADFLQQVDWIVENKIILKHFYPGQRVDSNIRLWCFVGEVLPEANSLLSRLDSNVCIESFIYSCLLLSSDKWLVVQPYTVKRILEKELKCGQPLKLVSELRKTEISVQQSLNYDSKISSLTQEEIDDFFSENNKVQTGFDADEDEITYVGPYFE